MYKLPPELTFCQHLTENRPHLPITFLRVLEVVHEGVESFINGAPPLGKAGKRFSELPWHFPNKRSRGPVRSHLAISRRLQRAFFCCWPLTDRVATLTSQWSETIMSKRQGQLRSMPGDLIEFGQFRWGGLFSFRKFGLNNRFPRCRGPCSLRSSVSGTDDPASPNTELLAHWCPPAFQIHLLFVCFSPPLGFFLKFCDYYF